MLARVQRTAQLGLKGGCVWTKCVLTVQPACVVGPWARVQAEPAAVLELVAHEEGKGYILGACISSPFAFHLGWITALIKHKEW